MARKREHKDTDASAAQASGTSDRVTIRVAVEPSDAMPSYYVNYAEVGFGPHDVSISFLKVPNKLNSVQIEETRTGPLRVEPSVQVTFAPTMVPGLIRALNEMKGRYEEQFGPIRKEEGQNE